MKTLISNPFAGLKESLKKVAVAALCVCVLFSMVVGCGLLADNSSDSIVDDNSSDSSDKIEFATGTIIGGYCNGWCELLVQVEKKYPIGKTIVYGESLLLSCTNLSKEGTYQNMIGVQPHLPLSDFPEGETVINKKISFSYRKFSDKVEDIALFLFSAGNTLCAPPEVPIYIITDCQIIQ